MNTSHLELQLTVGLLITVCIVGWLYYLWRKYRVRRPKPQDPSK
jgi:hypothetical protein